jgi:hypothetical protein
MGFEAAFVIFLGAVIVSRIISRRGLKYLSAEQKGRLVDSFSGMQAYGLIPVVLLVIAYVTLQRFALVSFEVLTVGYFALLIVWIAWNFWFTRKRMRTLDLPSNYLSAYRLAQAIQYAGIGVFLALILTGVD